MCSPSSDQNFLQGRCSQPQLYLLRHTKVVNPNHLCYGQAELPLATSFQDEVLLIKKNLGPWPWPILSSPSQRCLQLAYAMQTSQELEVDHRLLELSFGQWEGVPWSQIDRSTLDRWADDFVCGSPPEGESFLALQQRVVNAISDYLSSHDPKNLLVISHAGVLRAFYCFMNDWQLSDAFSKEIAFGDFLQWNLQEVSAKLSKQSSSL